jgi:hypothetical protein
MIPDMQLHASSSSIDPTLTLASLRYEMYERRV